MKTFKEIIEAHAGPPSKWREKAKFVKENKWIIYSAEIALRVLAAIEDNPDLNQAKLAVKLGVSPQQISKIVQGNENLSLETIHKLSEALQVELITFPSFKHSVPIKRRKTKQVKSKKAKTKTKNK